MPNVKKGGFSFQTRDFRQDSVHPWLFINRLERCSEFKQLVSWDITFCMMISMTGLGGTYTEVGYIPFKIVHHLFYVDSRL